jgi:hypothetical protein
MNNFKQHNVVMIATKVSSPNYTKNFIVKSIKEWTPVGENKIHLNKLSISVNHSVGVLEYYEPQHLYITSDDKIKDGDWVYENNLNQETKIYQIEKREGRLMFFRFKSVPIWLDKNQHNCKKIIATTDNSLEIKERECYPNGFYKGITNIKSLPQIPQSFIEHYITEYNKGNVITKVMVECEETKGTCDCYYTKFCKAPEHLKTGELCKDEQNYNLKVNPDNIINIKPIKDSWTKKELIPIFKSFYDLACRSAFDDEGEFQKDDFNKWIEQNL